MIFHTKGYLKSVKHLFLFGNIQSKKKKKQIETDLWI